MSNASRIIISVLLAAMLCAGAAAGEYNLGWGVVAGGGDSSGTSASYRLTVTAGQAAAGFAQGASRLHWIGFWAGEVPTPTVVSTLSAAKILPDGVFVSISGKIATSAGGDFADFFYVEEPGRSNGMRVAVPPGPIAELARGSVVNVIGTLGATPAGERQLTGPVVVIVTTQTPLTPLGMPNRYVGGGSLGDPISGLGQYGITGGTGLSNVGLLIKSWGRVIEVGSGYIVMDDGSSTPVRVSTEGMSSLPGMNDHITVVGISSIYKPGADRLRYVLPRERNDID